MPKKMSLSLVQMGILAGLVLALCGVCSAFVSFTYLNRTVLFGSSQAAAPTPIATATPSPTLTRSPSAPPMPTTTATSMLPTAIPTGAPTPTPTYAVAPEKINEAKIHQITEYVEQARQLTLPDEIPISFITRDQLRQQWQQESIEKATLDALTTQQQFYIALGLIEPGVDLAQIALDSQARTVLGYYDPEEKIMHVIAESVNMFSQEEMTFAHEYTHALQDHHFDLQRLLETDSSADGRLAARALPEGDARLVEALFARDNITQDQLDYNVYRYLLYDPGQIEGVSPALGIFTAFPYTAGEYFVISLFIEGGYSWEKVNQAYRHPPLSTEQVIHPEKYLAGERPTLITLPNLAPALAGSWQELDQDVLGEIGFLVWLIDQVAEETAINGAAGWDGDTYTLWVDETGRRLVAELSLWESEAEATEFYEAFSAYMNHREEESTGPGRWQHQEGVTLLSRQERQVLILIAPDQATLDRVLGQFIGF